MEGLDQIQYFIDGQRACGVNDIGLDCYEPEFFYPLDRWSEHAYRVELTITPELAQRAIGGVLYGFCHVSALAPCLLAASFVCMDLACVLCAQWGARGLTDLRRSTRRCRSRLSCTTRMVRGLRAPVWSSSCIHPQQSAPSMLHSHSS